MNVGLFALNANRADHVLLLVTLTQKRTLAAFSFATTTVCVAKAHNAQHVLRPTIEKRR